MRTIYEKTTGSLIKTADRSITSFPSGLIRVDQVYVGKSDDESTHRAALSYGSAMPNQNDTPAIDGLYIFPEVQESRDGSGLTKYQCSGYGRTTEEYRELTRSRNSFLLPTNTANVTLQIVADNLQGIIVKRNGEGIQEGEITFSDEFLKLRSVTYYQYPLIRNISISEISVSETFPIVRGYLARFDTTDPALIEQIFYVADPFIGITAQRNFGEFVEYEFNAARQGLENLETEN
jgi:hypothetical protein